MAAVPTLKPPSVHSRPSTIAPSIAPAGSTSSKVANNVTNNGSTGSEQLARRLLFPTLPPGTPFPPLLDDTPNDDHRNAELDVEIYALLALALRAYVAPWWTRLTRYDRDFIPHLGALLAGVVRVLAQRARAHADDAPELVFRAVPGVLAQHWADVRGARARAARVPGEDVVAAYRARAAHVGVCSASGTDGGGGGVEVEGVYVRAALDGVLRLVLPPEDWGCAAERAVVREVLAKVLCVDVLPLLSQPWFAHRMLLDALRRGGRGRDGGGEAVGNAKTPTTATERTSSSGNSGGGSLQGLLVFFLSAVQYLSGLCLTLMAWYKLAVQTVKAVNSNTAPAPSRGTGDGGYALSLLACASSVLNAPRRRTSRAAFDLTELALGFTEGFMDRWLIYTLSSHFLSASSALSAVRSVRAALFPGGYPGRPLEWPSPEEQAALRAELVDALLASTPAGARVLLFGPAVSAQGAQEQRAAVEEVLDGWASGECNVHAVLSVLDVFLLWLFPEMADVA